MSVKCDPQAVTGIDVSRIESRFNSGVDMNPLQRRKKIDSRAVTQLPAARSHLKPLPRPRPAARVMITLLAIASVGVLAAQTAEQGRAQVEAYTFYASPSWSPD